jgi:hypothetical protein
MKTTKLREQAAGPSPAVDRPFHLDVVDLGEGPPELLLLFFGGAAVSQAEYEARAATIYPGLPEALQPLEGRFPLRFAYVTAPYDFPFRRFANAVAEADRWRRHVAEELVPLVRQPPGLPIFLAGYSAGSILAFQLSESLDRCIGGGALGADGLTVDAQGERPTTWCSPTWAEPPLFIYNLDETVWAGNAKTVRDLDREEEVTLLRQEKGGHSLGAYFKNGNFQRLVLSAIVAAEAEKRARAEG